MKIERLNENQIRCTLNKSDLASRQLKINELAYGSDKAKELFRDMMQQASYELGFEAEDTPLMIEAIPVSSECIVLIVTKVDNPEELDTRFSRFSPSDSDDDNFDFDDIETIEGNDYSQADTIVNVLYKFQDSTWNTLMEKMPSITDLAQQTMDKVTHLNSFLGINIGEQPLTQLTTALHNGSVVGIILAVLIPVLAGLTQFISVKLQPQPAGDDKDNPMASSMKTMTYTMPLISVFMGFTLPAGLGLYWAASAAVRCIQQLAINKYLSTKSLDEMIKENQKKAQKKREKHGTSAKEINKMATTSTRNVGTVTKGKSGISEAEKEEKIQKAQQKAQNSKPGSLASKANLVSRYNSGQQTNQPKAEDESSSKEKKGKKK